MLIAWGTKCHKIELLQKRAVRLLYCTSPIVHTKPLFKRMKQPILSDLYTCQLLKLYYKLYRNRLPSYFKMFLPEYGAYRHSLRNDCIRLPAIRCEFGEMNAEYQMQLRLRDLTSPTNPPKYPSIHINEDTLGTSRHRFSSCLKMKFVNSYPNMCNLKGCYVCLNLN